MEKEVQPVAPLLRAEPQASPIKPRKGAPTKGTVCSATFLPSPTSFNKNGRYEGNCWWDKMPLTNDRWVSIPYCSGGTAGPRQVTAQGVTTPPPKPTLTFGIYCDWPCALAHAIELSGGRSFVDLVACVFKMAPDTEVTPHWTELHAFGGDKSIEELRRRRGKKDQVAKKRRSHLVAPAFSRFSVTGYIRYTNSPITFRTQHAPIRPKEHRLPGPLASRIQSLIGNRQGTDNPPEPKEQERRAFGKRGRKQKVYTKQTKAARASPINHRAGIHTNPPKGMAFNCFPPLDSSTGMFSIRKL